MFSIIELSKEWYLWIHCCTMNKCWTEEQYEEEDHRTMNFFFYETIDIMFPRFREKSNHIWWPIGIMEWYRNGETPSRGSYTFPEGIKAFQSPGTEGTRSTLKRDVRSYKLFVVMVGNYFQRLWLLLKSCAMVIDSTVDTFVVGPETFAVLSSVVATAFTITTEFTVAIGLIGVNSHREHRRNPHLHTVSRTDRRADRVRFRILAHSAAGDGKSPRFAGERLLLLLFLTARTRAGPSKKRKRIYIYIYIGNIIHPKIRYLYIETDFAICSTP